MKRKEFIRLMQTRAPDYSLEEIDEILSAFEDTLLEDIFAREDSVRLAVGTFYGITRKSFETRHPKTGEKYIVPEQHGFPRYRPSTIAKSFI